jgi:hypothetical protein
MSDELWGKKAQAVMWGHGAASIVGSYLATAFAHAEQCWLTHATRNAPARMDDWAHERMRNLDAGRVAVWSTTVVHYDSCDDSSCGTKVQKEQIGDSIQYTRKH